MPDDLRNLKVPALPSHRDVLASDEAHRTADPHTGVERANPPTADGGTTHLFGNRDHPSYGSDLPAHTVTSNPQSGSGIADTIMQEQNVRGMEVGTHHHTAGVTSVGRARGEGSAS